MTAPKLPALAESGLSRYLDEIKKFPMLDQQEEYMLAKAFADHQDVEAAHKLVTSHLRLVVKIAMGYKGYGLSITDMISEGNIGLMQAVKKYDPEAGVRLSTYAMWWIKASIQEFVLRSWSLVKVGTSAVQKKLFFNLRKVKTRINAVHEGDLTPEEVKKIATELDVDEEDVVDMNRLMIGGSYSINQKLGDDSNDEIGDLLPSNEESHELTIGNKQEYSQKQKLFGEALKTLNEREQQILSARQLQEPAATLEDLSQQFGISRERVRQIENKAIEKLKKAVIAA